MEILEIIRTIEAEKKAMNHAPIHATELDVRKRDAEAVKDLDSMEKCGLISMGRTINSRWIHIAGQKYE